VSPSRLQRRTPRDLTTVIATALSKDVDRRYQTAAALADDLRATLEHRPIAARPLSVAGRLARWARREPGLAIAFGLALITLPTITGFVIQRIVDSPKLEAQRKVAADQARDDFLMAAFVDLEEDRFQSAIDN